MTSGVGGYDDINIANYLLKNESYLGGTEDGKLSSDEVSLFFSSSHLNSTQDESITLAEFEKWYADNESALTAYYADLYGEENAEDYYKDNNAKKAMRESIIDLATNTNFLIPDSVTTTPDGKYEYTDENGNIIVDSVMPGTSTSVDFTNTVISTMSEYEDENGNIIVEQGKDIMLKNMDFSELGYTAPEPEETGLSDAEIADYAEQLYDAMKGAGTDEDSFDSVLYNSDITADDWANIINYYTDNYEDGFFNDVYDNFSGNTMENIINTVTQKLIESAEGGNDTAIEVLCEEFHKCTEEREPTLGGTGAIWEFINYLTENASDNVLGRMAEEYSTYNEGSGMQEDLTEEDPKLAYRKQYKRDALDRIKSAIDSYNNNKGI